MKRTIIYLLMMVMTVGGVVSCAEADSNYFHTDNTISSIWISPADNSSRIIYGDIDYPEEGFITFTIPRSERPYFPDLTSLKIKAVVTYDAMITPSLLGIKDLSSDFVITVTAKMTGETRQYILRAEYSTN